MFHKMKCIFLLTKNLKKNRVFVSMNRSDSEAASQNNFEIIKNHFIYSESISL